MTEDSDSLSEEERSLFRPFTRESLLVIQARIAEENAKQKELERKRAEGEVSLILILILYDVRMLTKMNFCGGGNEFVNNLRRNSF